jgi:hypothetical protein
MNRLSNCFVSLSCLWVGACQSESFQHEVAIGSPPPAIAGESASALQVPEKCAVYAPGGGDVDTPEAPFPDGFSIICAVDDSGASYGIVNGDAPTAHLAVLPGDREIGIYFGFEPGSKLADTYNANVLGGDNANIVAYSAPSNVHSSDCCAESHPEGRLPIRAVAGGPTGLMVSLGFFDSSATQVAGGLALDATSSWIFRFYVNGEPPAP